MNILLYFNSILYIYCDICRRGLSMFYQGKAQSFGSLARVQSVEDLSKKLERPNYRNKKKSCKSFGRYLCTPKATISKKNFKRSLYNN